MKGQIEILTVLPIETLLHMMSRFGGTTEQVLGGTRVETLTCDAHGT